MQKPVVVLVKDENGRWVRGGEARISNAQYAYLQRMLGDKRGMLAFIPDEQTMPALSTGEDDNAA